MSSDATRFVCRVALILGLLPFPEVARGVPTNQVAVRYFTDVTTVFDGQVFDDEDVVEDYLDGSVAQIPLGALPASAALSAYRVIAGGSQRVSFEDFVSLPGGLLAEPGDVVQTNFDGTAAYSLVFDASANGVPAGAIVDAIGAVGGDLLLSFDVTVTLPGGITAEDEDLVRVTGPSTFTLYFDGSAAGVPAGLDLNGVNRVAANNHLLLSFDGGGTVGGVDFSDEDILEYTPGGGTWELAYDGSSLHPTWPAADLGGADVLTDVDADALADEFETNSGIYLSPYDTGTNPADSDTDNDGLEDGVETNTGIFVSPQDTGSSPLDYDSDNDGYPDGTEVDIGSNPNDGGSTPAVPVPSLGSYGLLLLSLAMAGVGLGARRPRYHS